MKKGARSVDIGLRMNFLTTDPKDMMAKFQKVKNHIYFANDTHRFESVNEVIKTYKPGDGDELANMFSDHLKGAEKFYYMLDVINALRKNNILTKQVAHKMELELAKKYAVKNPVTEGYHVVRKGKQDAWISDKSYENLMKGKDVVGYIIDNEGGHGEVWVSKKDIAKVSKSNDALAKVADKYSKFESVKRMSETKFIAFFNGKKHEVEGKDLWDAKQKAITMLKVPKSKVGLLAVVNAGEHERGSFQFENLSPDVAKHMIGIYKGFSLVNGDGTMTYDTPANAKKAAAYLNKNKIAASTDGKYLYIESKTRR
jgi:hypothetical protein